MPDSIAIEVQADACHDTLRRFNSLEWIAFALCISAISYCCCCVNDSSNPLPAYSNSLLFRRPFAILPAFLLRACDDGRGILHSGFLIRIVLVVWFIVYGWIALPCSLLVGAVLCRSISRMSDDFFLLSICTCLMSFYLERPTARTFSLI